MVNIFLEITIRSKGEDMNIPFIVVLCDMPISVVFNLLWKIFHFFPQSKGFLGM